MDDVTHIVSGTHERGVLGRHESIPTQKRKPKISTMDSNRSRRQEETTQLGYRGDNNSLYSETNAHHTPYNPSNQHRRTVGQSGSATYHARYALQDSEDLERAFARSQNDYMVRKVASRDPRTSPRGLTELDDAYDQSCGKDYDNYHYMSPTNQRDLGESPLSVFKLIYIPHIVCKC